MIESIITLLIYIAIVALVIYVVLYALSVIGVTLPGKVVQIIWLIFGLVVLLWLARMFIGAGGVPFPA
jgi:hypothetical protein